MSQDIPQQTIATANDFDFQYSADETIPYPLTQVPKHTPDLTVTSTAAEDHDSDEDRDVRKVSGLMTEIGYITESGRPSRKAARNHAFIQSHVAVPVAGQQTTLTPLPDTPGASTSGLSGKAPAKKVAGVRQKGPTKKALGKRKAALETQKEKITAKRRKVQPELPDLTDLETDSGDDSVGSGEKVIHIKDTSDELEGGEGDSIGEEQLEDIAKSGYTVRE